VNFLSTQGPFGEIQVVRIFILQRLKGIFGEDKTEIFLERDFP